MIIRIRIMFLSFSCFICLFCRTQPSLSCLPLLSTQHTADVVTLILIVFYILFAVLYFLL